MLHHSSQAIPSGSKSGSVGLHEGVRAVSNALEKEYISHTLPVPTTIRDSLSPTAFWLTTSYGVEARRADAQLRSGREDNETPQLAAPAVPAGMASSMLHGPESAVAWATSICSTMTGKRLLDDTAFASAKLYRAVALGDEPVGVPLSRLLQACARLIRCCRGHAVVIITWFSLCST